jgi:prepilin-type N-terminal cleavage/methylation domain-containing protein
MRVLAGRRWSRLSGRSGVTLVELLVTMTILAIGLVGVASMFIVAYQSQIQAHYASVATDAAAAKIEEMKAAGFGDINATTFPPTFTVAGLPSGQGTCSFQPYPNSTSTDQYAINVTVAWEGGPRIAGRVSLPLVLSKHR